MARTAKKRRTWALSLMSLPAGLSRVNIPVTLTSAVKNDAGEIVTPADVLMFDTFTVDGTGEGVNGFMALLTEHKVDSYKWVAGAINSQLQGFRTAAIKAQRKDASKWPDPFDANALIPPVSKVRTIDPEEAAGEAYTRKVAEARKGWAKTPVSAKERAAELNRIYSECFPD